MATATKKTGIYGDYYAGSLGAEERKVNALYICKYLLAQKDQKWTLNAIAGLLGNIQAECGLNPGTVEALGSGFGLIQWTPGSIHKNWCTDNGYEDATTMDANLAHIVWEANNNESWYPRDGYNESYKEFAESTESPYYLACVYAWNRERSGVVSYGFHTNYHSRYCYPSAAFEIACRQCYEERYGKAATETQAAVNRKALKDTRGGWANDWYNYLVNELFEARLDESDTSVLTNKYWVSSRNNRGGLNYNTAIEDWSNAQKGWTSADQNAIKGTGTVLPNCTSWAWGRAYEITQEQPPIFSGDAGNWWNSFDSLSEESRKGYKKSTTTPALGAIACWRNPDNHASMGHVAIVEAIHDDGTISISESGYTTWVWRPSYFNVQKNVDPTKIYTKYEFVGYIHLPGYSFLLPSIDSFELKDEYTESADFKISINTNGSIIDKMYYIIYQDGVEVASKDLILISGENDFSATDLVPNEEYSIRVFLEVGSTVVESNPVSFITKQDYPDQVKNVFINTQTKNLETATFSLNVEPPERWGYWQRIGNDYGYRIYFLEDCKLAHYIDQKLTNGSSNYVTNVIPNLGNVNHEKNFQIGVSSWVTDNDALKVFALPGEEYPVGSNSVFLIDESEISDTCYTVKDNEIHKVQPYIRESFLNTFKPLKIFKL